MKEGGNMIDREKDIRSQAMLKSIWEGLPHTWADDPIAVKARVALYFQFSLELIEAYAKVEPPTNAPERFDLRDEQVARSLPEPKNNWPKQANGDRKFAFASEKQANRAYAIWKSAGWEDKDAKAFLFDRWGIANPKRIPTEVYNEVCQALNDGPQ